MRYFVILLILIGILGFTGSASAFEPSYTNYFSNSEFQIYKIYENAYEFSIPYNISNAELDKIDIDCNSTTLIVYLDKVAVDGNLVINIPRALLDMKINEQDVEFIVIIDQLETEYQETSESDSRTLDIQLRPNSKVLEIIATNVGMFPEPIPCAIGGSDESPYYRLVSPLKQFNSGISLNEIQCKNDLVLVQKYDNTAACVKKQTKIKLIERGWATADQLENKIITPEDNDRLIDIKKGESFIVKLDSGYGWRISIDNQTVVDSDYSDIRYSGSQGVYRALNSGQAILTGVGDPLCLSLDPPCMSPSILFQLNINVR